MTAARLCGKIGNAASSAPISPLPRQWVSGQATWRQRRDFEVTARRLIRLPDGAAEPLGHLLSEADWRTLAPPGPQEEDVLEALSQATGIFFFPSTEWVLSLDRFIRLLGIRRVLEVGAGRGYLAAALAPWLTPQGLAFRAVDKALGEFESGLPRHPVVEIADALGAVQAFHPDLVIYAWPPPGQSILPLCQSPGVRYVLLLGEEGGGCTGDPADWHSWPHRRSARLSRLGVGRTGRRQQAAVFFYGAASSYNCANSS